MISAGAWINLLLVPAVLAGAVVAVTAVRLSFARVGPSRRVETDDELPGRFDRLLRSAGVAVPPIIFNSFALLISGVIALAVIDLAGGLIAAGLIALLACLYLIYSGLQALAHRRTRRLEEKLVDAIDIMAATLRGSDNPRAALDGAAHVSPAPVAAELREVIRRLDLGMPIRRALLRLRSNYDCEGVRLFSSTLCAKWGAGGDLGPTLASVNRVIRERLRHRLRVRSKLAGANTASWMVAICPYLALAAMWHFNPEWIERLFAHSMGPFLFFSAIALQIVGFLWLRRMARVEL